MSDFLRWIRNAFTMPQAEYPQKSDAEYAREAWERIGDAWQQTGDDLREAMGLEPKFRK